MYNLVRDWVAAGESRTYSWENGVQSVLCISGEVTDLPVGRSVVLEPEQVVVLTAVEDSMLTVFSRPAVDLPSPLHANATLTDGKWVINNIDGKNIFLKHNNDYYEKATRAVTDDYPQLEKDTWPTQSNEVYAWVANPSTALTPWIDDAAARRGLEREQYLRRTLVKSVQFSRISSFLTGTRQRYEDSIKMSIAPELDYTVPDAIYAELQSISIQIMTVEVETLKDIV